MGAGAVDARIVVGPQSASMDVSVSSANSAAALQFVYTNAFGVCVKNVVVVQFANTASVALGAQHA